MPDLKLGLIGDKIAASSAPLLHRLAGTQFGMEVQYDLLVPRELGMGFEEAFDYARKRGYHGLNITYPYKERAAGLVEIPDNLVKTIGAVNTVVFESAGPKGFNTDYSGFVAAFRAAFAEQAVGTVAIVGAGGVGKAIAFGLVALGARVLRLYDRDPESAEALAHALRDNPTGTSVQSMPDVETATKNSDGLINCTPVGMVGYPGTAIPFSCMAQGQWVFDAVYTPRDTQFLTDAETQGLKTISGYELFIFQGIHAWKLFDGRLLNEGRLRADLGLSEVA